MNPKKIPRNLPQSDFPTDVLKWMKTNTRNVRIQSKLMEISKYFKIKNVKCFKSYQASYGPQERNMLAICDFYNRKCGYIYYYEATKNSYVCIPCDKRKRYVSAKILSKKNGKTYLKLGKNKHVCKPVKHNCYTSHIKMDPTTIPRNPPQSDFPSDVLKWMKSNNSNHYLQFKLMQLCKYFQYENYKRFKLYEEILNQKEQKRLAIFDYKNVKHGYIYSQIYKQYYLCTQCTFNEFVCAEVLETENGYTYVKLVGSKHSCTPLKL